MEAKKPFFFAEDATAVRLAVEAQGFVLLTPSDQPARNPGNRRGSDSGGRFPPPLPVSGYAFFLVAAVKQGSGEGLEGVSPGFLRGSREPHPVADPAAVRPPRGGFGIEIPRGRKPN